MSLSDNDAVDAAWRDYADRIKAAGESITGNTFPIDPRLRAEGYRFIKRIENLAHLIYVEFPTSTHPMLFRYGDDTTPFGSTNADNNYYRAMVDPGGTYQITANLSGVKEILFSIQTGEYVLGQRTVLAELARGDLEIEDDGGFELILGGSKRTGNWLPLDKEAAIINVRQFVADWEHDGIAVLNIERLDDVGPPENLSPAAMVTALDKAATWVEASVTVWNEHAVGHRSRASVNKLSAPAAPPGGALSMLVGMTLWNLEPHQALILEFEQPDATYWSIQNYVIEWSQPLDYVNRVTSLNDRQLTVDDDGLVRVVLAHGDPGVPNWLDTSGLYEGSVSYRYVKPKTAPAPRTMLVDLADIRARLPLSTPQCTPADRRAQIVARRRGIARRFRR